MSENFKDYGLLSQGQQQQTRDVVPGSLVGVCFDKAKHKFKAYVDMFGIRVRLGSTFPSAAEAASAVASYKANITSSPRPLQTFIASHFGVSPDTALVFIADAIQLYYRSGSDMKFPNFTVARIKNGARPITNPTIAKSVLDSPSLLPLSIAQIVFGNISISQARRIYHIRYEDVANAFINIECAINSASVK